jgi:predicted hydrocarbon binding protein
MAETGFPTRIMFRFAEILIEELGTDTFLSVLLKASLPEEWAQPTYFAGLDSAHAAQAYSRLQSALRAYYGRGARGILLRIGSKLWGRLLEDAGIGTRAQAALIRGLPKSLRRKPALELLARSLSVAAGNVKAHVQDLDLLLVDQTSPTTLDQSDASPICFVTFGLIRECLFWADGQEHDIEERACRALGAHQCEFKVTILQ